MFTVLQLATVILAVVAMVPALAHALELPGKMRLTREAYMVVQPIYYPGFTLAGLSEPGAILATILLLFMAEPGSTDFWLTGTALVALGVMHAVYWFRTHPVNNFWLQGENLGKAGARFFTAAHAHGNDAHNAAAADWQQLRDQWEHSHLLRAVLAVLAFIALLLATSPVTGG
jgi:hypothetical protein